MLLRIVAPKVAGSSPVGHPPIYRIPVVCWGGICELGWLETGLLNPQNTPKSGHKLGSPGTGSGTISSFNKPLLGRYDDWRLG
jgi:hypothetical protein